MTNKILHFSYAVMDMPALLLGQVCVVFSMVLIYLMQDQQLLAAVIGRSPTEKLIIIIDV